jgi:hypothetical protein
VLARFTLWRLAGTAGAVLAIALVSIGMLGALVLVARWRARMRRCYVRLRVLPYRTDRTSVEGLVAMYAALHKRLQRRPRSRLLGGQPSLALELHYRGAAQGAPRAWLAVVCPAGLERMIAAALRSAYPNCALAPRREDVPDVPPVLLRLCKRSAFVKRVKALDRHELEREPPVERLMTVLDACREDAIVQLALTPAPTLLERYARHRYRRHEAALARARHLRPLARDRSRVEEVELHGALALQHRCLFFTDVRVAGASRTHCERIASELRAETAENRLVARAHATCLQARGRRASRYRRRVLRGEGNPWPAPRRAIFACTELPALWHVPSVEYATVPFARGALPLAPAVPAIMRPHSGPGTLRDALGPVCVEPALRSGHIAVTGAAGQGKSSFLLTTIAADMARERCAIVVLDPAGAIAEATAGLVPNGRPCMLLDLANPACGLDLRAAHARAERLASWLEVEPQGIGSLLRAPAPRLLLSGGLPALALADLLASGGVLIVCGALAELGAGETTLALRVVLCALEAVLLRQQLDVHAARPVSVALKVDDAQLLLAPPFAELLMSHGEALEVVACWQNGARRPDLRLCEQLEAVFAHRVYFATSSPHEARASAQLLMVEHSDVLRSGLPGVAALAHPDLRLRLPRHHAIASWTTLQGRQPPFLARTIPRSALVDSADPHDRGDLVHPRGPARAAGRR